MSIAMVIITIFLPVIKVVLWIEKTYPGLLENIAESMRAFSDVLRPFLKFFCSKLTKQQV